MRPNLQKTADLVTFTEEILNGRLHFLCSVYFVVLNWVSRWIAGSSAWGETFNNAIGFLKFETNIAVNWFINAKMIANPDKSQTIILDKKRSDLTNNQLIIDNSKLWLFHQLKFQEFVLITRLTSLILICHKSRKVSTNGWIVSNSEYCL